MNTTGGANTRVIGVDGNFGNADRRQQILEACGQHPAGRMDLLLRQFDQYRTASPADRLLLLLLFRSGPPGRIELGDLVNFSVQTGNFGDILAGYYAKLTGLPVNRLICASNSNNVLTDFFNGQYVQPGILQNDQPVDGYPQFTSNLERLLFDKLGRDSKSVVQLMDSCLKKRLQRGPRTVSRNFTPLCG